jgi:glycine cleavage system aminomethyltransferase T/glycine/D-amino acid oxidase-like deaminating enzyme
VTTPPATASIVVIGAGIVGCATAYHLTRLGWRDVVVLEQGPLPKAGGSTSHAPGLVFQTNPSRTMTAFAQETVALYRSLELDGEPCWYGVGSIEVAATPARWQDLKRRHGWAQSWGLAAELLSPQAVRELVPLLDPARILGGYHVPSDGVANAVRAGTVLSRIASAAGATFHARTPVTGIEVEAGAVRAVATPAGRIATDRVLVCAGIWSPRLGRMAGVPVPLMPVEHQLAWTAPLPELAGETREVAHPILRHQDRDLYFRQRRDGYAVGSYQHEPVLIAPDAIRRHDESGDMPASRPFDHATFQPALADAIALLPTLAGVEFVDALNGMFSFTPDGFPLLGESSKVRGFWTAAAVWITHAGGVARTVAEWLTGGPPALDLHECDLNRFEPHAATPAYLRERAAQQYREIYDVIHPLQPLERPRPLRTSPFYHQTQALHPVFFEARGWESARWYEGNASLLDRYPVPDRDGWAGRHWSPIAGAEHLATRAGVALFDMSTLTKIEVTGPGAVAFLEQMTTNRVDRPVGSVTYALLLNERGGIQSDITVARLAADHFQLGANGLLDLAWLRSHLPADGSVQVRDVTGALTCAGLWGPRARDLISLVSDDDFGNDAFPYYTARQVAIGEVPVTALRVSYVGELGWELYCSPEYGARLLHQLREAGEQVGLVVAGRAAFDTLRLEKGYRLWGTDMTPEHDPFEAGLGFAVKLKKECFNGREALLAAKERGPHRRLVCLTLADPAAVVMGKEPILAGDEVVGYVTSAGFGYSVGCSIAYGYLSAALAAEGTSVEIVYFGDRCPATVARDPLFDPEGVRLRA